MPSETTKLLPCPFCGGDAEMDTMRAYRAMSPRAGIGHGVAEGDVGVVVAENFAGVVHGLGVESFDGGAGLDEGLDDFDGGGFAHVIGI